MVETAHGAIKISAVNAREPQISKPWSDYARRLIMAYDICSSIRKVFADDVTYINEDCFVPGGTC